MNADTATVAAELLATRRRHDLRRRTDEPDPRALDGDALYRQRDRSLDELAARIPLPATGGPQ